MRPGPAEHDGVGVVGEARGGLVPKGMRVVVGLLGPRAPDAPFRARAIRVEPD
jgi:hypothetical protein